MPYEVELEKSMFLLKEFLNDWNSFASYTLEVPSIKAFERRIKRNWRDQDIVYNDEAALISGHSDWAENDISLDSSDNDLNIQV